MAKALHKCIGKNIRQLRLDKNLSQEDVAEKLGISRNAYGAIERGESNPSIDRISDIYSVFGINLNTVFNNIKTIN